MSLFTKIPCWSPNASPPLAEATKEKCARNELNKEQLAALEVLEGRHVINSPAGSGKSTVLIARMLKIRQAYPDSHVLMISFTKKSAQELRDRIGGVPNVTVSTFHSLAFQILRSSGEHFTVVTNEAAQDAIISKLIGKKCTTLEDVRRSLHQVEVDDEDTKIVREKFLTFLRKQHQTIFNTLQIFALRALRDNPSLLRQWQERFDFYEIDEYQDCDALQVEIIHLLAQRTGNLTVVGDRRQSIYSFRGAVPDAMDNFAKNATKYDLSINYRSNRAILGLANRIMATEKPLIAAVDNPAPVHVKYLMAMDGLDEAKTVVNEIVALHKEGTAYKDMAVLFRSCSASSQIVQELLRRKIPAVSKGTVSLNHTKPPYCGIIRLFRFMLNPDDKERFKIILPILYLRKSALNDIVAILVKDGCTLMEAAQKLNLPFFHREYLSELSEAMDAAAKMSPSQAAIHLLRHGYGKYIGPDFTEAIKHMADELKEFPSIMAYINFIDNLKEQAEAMRKLAAVSTDYIQLMTIHSAKGLEKEVIFLIGVYQGGLPSAKTETTDLVAEERRLLYVAVTRAKERLYISYPRLSENRKEPNEVSQFLREIF